MLRATTWLVVALSSLHALPALANGFADAYQPFPDIPQTSVQQDPFVSELVTACAKVGQAAVLSGVPDRCEVKHEPDALLARARGKDTEATAISDITAWAGQVKHACARLLAPADQLRKCDLEVLKQVRDNPEARALLTKLEPATTVREALASGGSLASPLSAVGSAFGSLSDNLIRGMAEFLTKRAKEEALRYLREELKKKMCANDAQVFFRNTCSAIESVDDSQSLQAIGTYIRSAAERDLASLPDVSLAYLEHKDPARGQLAFAGRAGLAFYAAAKTGRKPVDVLKDFGATAALPCEKKGCSELARVVRLASAIGYAAHQEGTLWAVFYEKLATASPRVAGVGLLLLADKRTVQLEKDRPSADRALMTFDLALYNKALLGARFWQGIVAFDQVWTPLEQALQDDLPAEERKERIIDTIARSADLIADMVSDLALLTIPAGASALQTDLAYFRTCTRTASALAKRDYGGAVLAFLQEIPLPKKAPSLPASITRYVPLIVELARADSSNAVAATLDAYAAPVGSYRAKYLDADADGRRLHVTLNGFVGIMLAQERLASDGVSGKSFAVGAFMPVGVHVSYAVSSLLHIGVLVAVIDLGALTTYRKDTKLSGHLQGQPSSGQAATVDKAPELGWKQIFSPGAFATLGLFGTPLVLGAGVSVSPELRRVQEDTLDTRVPALRIGGFLAVDVSILALN